MKKPLCTASFAFVLTVLSTASFAQDIPLNILVTGTTGGESVQGATFGSLVTTSTTTTTVSSVAAAIAVSTESSISTD